jgi:hypothetical protein
MYWLDFAFKIAWDIILNSQYEVYFDIALRILADDEWN